MRSVAGYLLLWLAPCLCQTAWAEKYALLVGLSTYRSPAINSLDGPASDVSAVQRALTNSWGFSESHVTTLVNEAATRRSILESLDHFVAQVRAGDYLFVYLSGHGTSWGDAPNANLGLPAHTGAFLPYDTPLGDSARTLEALLIGTRDLKPRFLKIDGKVEVFLVIDACYSEFTARSLDRRLAGKSRYQPLAGPKPASQTFGASTADKQPFPYKTLVYLAASSYDEQARDVGWPDIRAGRKTFDGQPHGALTDALLAGLGTAASPGGGRRISYRELAEFVRLRVRNASPQTPHLLYAETNQDIAQRAIFAVSGTSGGPMFSQEGPLRVRIHANDDALRQRILRNRKIAEARNEDWEYLVEDIGQRWRIVHRTGSAVEDTRDRETIGRILDRHAALKELRNLGASQYPIELRPERPGKAVFFEGDPVTLRLSAARDCFPLAVSISPAGGVNILLPGRSGVPELRAPLRAGVPRPIHLGTVESPWGMETVHFFALPLDAAAEAEELAGAEFEPVDAKGGNTAEFDLLLRLVNHSQARTRLSLQTTPK